MTIGNDAEVLRHQHMNLTDITTLVQVDELHKLLKDSGYPLDKTKFLIEGFSQGFRLQYAGKKDRKDSSNNLPFRDGVGNKIEL